MPRPAGRFAPSPTGDLHFGSLVAALASCLQARSTGGEWLVRVEDIDPPREVPGSTTRILADLGRFGMVPDRAVLYQSDRLSTYREATQWLLEQNLAFVCTCSRSMLPESGIYPGTCRVADHADRAGTSVRLRVPARTIRFTDRVQGVFKQRIDHEVGDFVIRRADGLPAYQLAVVVDDAFQGVTEVVRGADLLDSTPRQIMLQSALGLPTPAYMHLPLATLPDGSKLSKQLGSDPVRTKDPVVALVAALSFLGQSVPRSGDLQALWQWAMQHWDPERIPRQRKLPWSAHVLMG